MIRKGRIREETKAPDARASATDQERPPPFRRLLSQHPPPPTPEGPSRLLHRLFAASIAFVVSEQLGCLWTPSSRASISTRQDSLSVTGRCLAPLSPGDTPLQHLRSPGSTGSLLRGLLAVATTGLSPASSRQIHRAEQRWVGPLSSFQASAWIAFMAHIQLRLCRCLASMYWANKTGA